MPILPTTVPGTFANLGYSFLSGILTYPTICEEEIELYDLRNIVCINTPLNSVILEDICATSFHDKSFFIWIKTRFI